MQQCFGVDIGNSGIRVAELRVPQHELGELLRIDWCYPPESTHPHSSGTARRYQPDQAAWLEELAKVPASNQPTHWLISSVRSDACELLESYIRAKPQDSFQRVTCDCIPLALHVDYPQRVGIDRLLAALAATDLVPVDRQPQPAIVVQAGSAVTVDLLNVLPPNYDARGLLGTFEGGAIIPGVPMMLRLLGQGAAMLPQLDAETLLQLPNWPGKNTADAMLCGTSSALVGGVTHLIDRYRAQFTQPVPVILSGGDGLRLSPYLQSPIVTKSHLVQWGLLKLWELTQAGRA